MMRNTLILIAVIFCSVAAGESASAQQLQVIGNSPNGPICAGPLGPGPCAAIQQYLLQQQQTAQQQTPQFNPQQLQVINIVPGVGPICNGPLGPGACNLVQQYILDHSGPTVPQAQTFGLPGRNALSPQQLAIECAQRARFDVSVFAGCAGQQVILPQNQQALLDCAVSSSTTQNFAECAAPQLGIQLSKEQRVVAQCAMKSDGDTSDFLNCAGSAIIGQNLTPDQQAVLDCAGDSDGDASNFATCSASHLLGAHASREQKIALECAAQSEGDYTVMATCAGANLFNMNLNPEQQIAVQCVVSTGGQPYAAAGCIATRLTARELVKCVTEGFGGSGCFGDDNDLIGRNGWTARTLGQVAGGPNSIINNPGQIWGGDNSFVRNPGQIWGGSNSFVNNPSQFWGGNNSIFNNPGQLVPNPINIGTVGGKRICIPWC